MLSNQLSFVSAKVIEKLDNNYTLVNILNYQKFKLYRCEFSLKIGDTYLFDVWECEKDPSNWYVTFLCESFHNN